MIHQRRPVTGPSVWYGAELQDGDDWVTRLMPGDIDEIDAAVSAVVASGRPLEQLSKADFRLPKLGDRLSELHREVVHGPGFCLIKGLPVGRYSARESAIAFYGIGTHLGRAVPQNARGHLLGHVIDLGRDPRDPTNRIYETNYRHLFHTDSCDVVGLLCLRPARAGGLSSIASSTTLYNEMLAVRPDLVQILAEPFHVDRKGEVPAGKGPHYRMAVFHEFAGYVSTIYARDFIEAATRHADVPPLSDEQIEALDLFDHLAASDRLRLDMTLEPGDMQWLHNHQVLHARTAYEDYPEFHRRRHLLRLWLSPTDGRPLPPVFEERYGPLVGGARRGGIIVPGSVECVPLEAGG